MKKIVMHLKVQEYNEDEPSEKHVEYRCAVPQSTFESVTQQALLAKSIAAWVGTAKQCFEASPHEQYGGDAIDRQQTVNNLKHLTAMVESGKHDCSEVFIGYDAINLISTFHFSVKSKNER